MSHSIRGAWIEINLLIPFATAKFSRTLYGVRGLKYPLVGTFDAVSRRTLYGVRGLKFLARPGWYISNASHSIRGAWIEIINYLPSIYRFTSHSIRGAWIEISLYSFRRLTALRRTLYGVRGLK